MRLADNNDHVLRFAAASSDHASNLWWGRVTLDGVQFIEYSLAQEMTSLRCDEGSSL